MQLYNIHDKEYLQKQLEQEPFQRITLSFYQYARIEDPQAFRDELYAYWSSIRVLGRIYVAAEGINGQISVPEPFIEDFRKHLYEIPFLDGARLNFAIEEKQESFVKLIVRLRDKIVADGIDDPRFDATQTGIHLKAEEFNKLAEKDDTVIVDMRNHYESEVGHFENAVCPDVDTFRDSLPIVEEMLQSQKDKNIVLYCTGGIRCEKASAFLKYKGFENVYQLEGGIIEYTRQARQKGLPNKFIGKNFVFDDRLGERISDDIIAHCHQCGKPCDDHTNCKNEACHMLFIQCEDCKAHYDGCCSDECREFNRMPEEEKVQCRKGSNLGRNIFRKGRFNEKKFSLKKD